MNIINQITLSIISLPFGVLIFFPAIIISIVLLVLIFYKNKKKAFNSVDTDSNTLPIQEELKKDSFLNFIFKKDKIFYYRYLAVVIFLLILLIGSYSPLFYCSYEYSTIVQIAIIISSYVFLRLIKQILIFFNIKFTRIIMLILVIFTILSYSSIFILNVIKQGFFSFSDSVKPTCYGIYPPREKTEIIPGLPWLDINNEEKTTNTFKYDPNGPYPSPLVDKNIMVNARGEVVDKWVKGTFKIIGTNEMFEYSERYNPNGGSMTDYSVNPVNDCITLNCKFIYFASKNSAIFNDKDDPAIGVIDKVILTSEGKEVVSSYVPNKIDDKVIYSITFTQSGESGQMTTDTEDLCMRYKGRGFSCHTPTFSKGNKIIFVHNPSYGVKDENRSLIINDTFKAELISYQYSMSPDTGEVFPVVIR